MGVAASRTAAVVVALVAVLTVAGCTPDRIGGAAAPTPSGRTGVRTDPAPAPSETAAPMYRLRSGRMLPVDPGRPVPAAVLRDARRTVAKPAARALTAKDGNEAVAADEALWAAADRLADALHRPVGLVYRGTSSDGLMWSALGSGHTDLYTASGAWATPRKADAMEVARRWTRGNGGAVVVATADGSS